MNPPGPAPVSPIPDQPQAPLAGHQLHLWLVSEGLRDENVHRQWHRLNQRLAEALGKAVHCAQARRFAVEQGQSQEVQDNLINAAAREVNRATQRIQQFEHQVAAAQYLRYQHLFQAPPVIHQGQAPGNLRLADVDLAQQQPPLYPANVHATPIPPIAGQNQTTIAGHQNTNGAIQQTAEEHQRSIQVADALFGLQNERLIQRHNHLSQCHQAALREASQRYGAANLAARQNQSEQVLEALLVAAQDAWNKAIRAGQESDRFEEDLVQAHQAVVAQRVPQEQFHQMQFPGNFGQAPHQPTMYPPVVNPFLLPPIVAHNQGPLARYQNNTGPMAVQQQRNRGGQIRPYARRAHGNNPAGRGRPGGPRQEVTNNNNVGGMGQ